MQKKKTVCFFSYEDREALLREQYSIQDINILNELGFNVVIATSFAEIPWGCDLYFSWWTSGSILPFIKARLSGKPIIVVAGGNDSMFYYDSVTKIPNGYLTTAWYKKLATRITLRFSSVIIVVSEFMTNDVKMLGARDPITVHNSINTDVFIRSNLPREYVTSIFKIDENVLKVKRGEIFIRSIPRVLEKFPDQKFIIIGGKGNAYSRINKLVQELGIAENIEFLGNINNADVVKWLQSSKAYIQTSDTETFGVAIAEAMSCGTPVVVSRRGAIPEIVGDCGIFVDQNDPDSVAQGIIEVLSKSNKEFDDIGTRSRDRIVSNFSYEKRKSQIGNILKDLL